MHNDKTAVIYCRVSTVRQAQDELPIQSQQQRCEDKARSLGATVLRVYADEGLSGQSDTRPAFQQAILYCETHSPTYLITWSTSRFARNRLDAQLYKRRLSRVETTLVYASLDIDRDTDGGWLTEGLLELIDEYNSKQTAADTRRSMIKAAQGGYWCGGHPPFGYRSVPATDDPKRRRLEVVPEEAVTVKRLFTLRAQGMGAKNIAMTLNDDGHTNRRNPWNKTSLLALLRNQAVIGNLCFGKQIRVNGERRRADPNDWIIVPSHPAIIDLDLWTTVQRMLDADAVNTQPVQPGLLGNGSPHSTYLFTGLLQCGQCGASLQIETAKGRGRRYSYYNCRTAQRKGGCPPRRLPARELDDWLLEVLCADLFTPATLRSAVHDLREITGRWHTEQAERIQALEGQIKEVKRRNSKLYEVLEELGRDTPNLGDLTRRLRDNNATIRKLEEQRITLEAEQPPQVEIADEDLEELAEVLITTLKSGYNPGKTRALFADFIKRIVIEGASMRIEYDPHRLIGVLPPTACRLVPSRGNWLPSPTSPGTATLTRLIPAAVLPRRAKARRYA